jgi:light-regulated signal transduction histidine kinase (bacteriophytochrome)
LVRDITEPKRLESELRRATEELELRVRERTAQLANQAEELRQANEALERSNLELKQFAYIASHDLQSPLRNISGFVQLLRSEYEGRLGERADDWIRRTVQSIQLMQSLIQDLLAYSRVDSQFRPLQPVAMRDVYDDALSLLETSLRDTGAEVSRDELPAVVGDRAQLVQLLQNLIGNALTYHGDQPPRVHVSAQHSDDAWVFCVSDNGIGIDAKYHERIFEIFQRLHDQRKYPGTGIGLAVCRRVVLRHGGKIWVESKPGEGSRFYFSIPQRSPA